MQSGGSLRIGTELVDVATGSQLWGAQYDRKPGDIFVVQDEISSEISGKLRLHLTRAEKKQLTKRHTQNAEAYQLYLKGRHHWNRWTEEGFYKAIEHFQQAIENDPSYALAYAGLADCYVLLGWNSYLPPKEAFPKGQVGGEGRPAARPGSRRSPHGFCGPVVASRLGVGEVSGGIQTKPRTWAHLRNCQPLVRRVCNDHGATCGSYDQDEDGARISILCHSSSTSQSDGPSTLPADTTKPSNNSGELSIWTPTIPSLTGFLVCCSGKRVVMSSPSLRVKRE